MKSNAQSHPILSHYGRWSNVDSGSTFHKQDRLSPFVPFSNWWIPSPTSGTSMNSMEHGRARHANLSSRILRSQKILRSVFSIVFCIRGIS